MTPTRVRSGKLWPLETSWVPITRSAPPPAICLDARLQRGRAFGEVGGEDREAGVGPERRRLLGQPLDAGAERGHPALGLAGGAGVGDRLRRAALVADEALAEAVLDHAGVALVAADLVAAGAADGERRVAAAVEEEERLLAGGEALVDRARQRRRRSSAPARAGRARRSIARISGSSATPKRSGRSSRAYLPASAFAQDLEARAWRRRAPPPRPRSRRAAPPCRGRGRARRPPACRSRRAPRRRR